jgi:zinc protease
MNQTHKHANEVLPFKLIRWVLPLLLAGVLAILPACSFSKLLTIGSPEEQASDRFDSLAALPVQRWQLANGLSVLFLYDDELPLLRASLATRGGSLWEPKQFPGLYQILGAQMRAGGAGKRSADQLDVDLERLSASISSAVGGEFGRFSLSCLSTDFAEVFPIFADVVQRPRFSEQRLQLAKGQMLESIRRRVDDPSTIASMSFGQLLWGDAPYGRVVTSADVQRVRVETLRSHSKRLFRPQGAVLAVVGKISRAELEAAIEAQFGSWSAPEVAEQAAPELAPAAEPAIYFIEKPFAQATIYYGHYGVPRLSPDYPQIDVFNHIFGTSGFTSRLMERVRSNLGLAYGTYGAITSGLKVGSSVVYVQTKAESAGQALAASLQVVQEMRTQPVTSAELQQAQRSINNSFVFNFATPEAALDGQFNLQLLRYPPDYYQTYLPKISAVNLAQVQEVANTRLEPEKFIFVVVGNAQAYESVLQAAAQLPGMGRALPVVRLDFDETLKR